MKGESFPDFAGLIKPIYRNKSRMRNTAADRQRYPIARFTALAPFRKNKNPRTASSCPGAKLLAVPPRFFRKNGTREAVTGTPVRTYWMFSAATPECRSLYAVISSHHTETLCIGQTTGFIRSQYLPDNHNISFSACQEGKYNSRSRATVLFSFF